MFAQQGCDLIDVWGSASNVDYGNDPKVRSVLDEIFATQTADEWQDLFLRAGVPGCKVVDAAGIIQLEHFTARDLAERASADGLLALADAIRWGDGSRPGHQRTLAPQLGQHSQEIIANWLHEVPG